MERLKELVSLINVMIKSFEGLSSVPKLESRHGRHSRSKVRALKVHAAASAPRQRIDWNLKIMFGMNGGVGWRADWEVSAGGEGRFRDEVGRDSEDGVDE